MALTSSTILRLFLQFTQLWKKNMKHKDEYWKVNLLFPSFSSLKFIFLRFQFSHPFMLSNEFIFIYMPYKTECNLSSKDSTTTDDSIDYIACSSKCLNDLNNIELCSCHQNNEIGKEKNVFILAITVTLDMTLCRCIHVQKYTSFSFADIKMLKWCIYSISLFRKLMSKYCWCCCDDFSRWKFFKHEIRSRLVRLKKE